MVFKKGHKTWLGKRHSDETKIKMSEANKGRKAWNKGKSPSEETKRKMGEAQMGRRNQESLGVDEHI